MSIKVLASCSGTAETQEYMDSFICISNHHRIRYVCRLHYVELLPAVLGMVLVNHH